MAKIREKRRVKPIITEDYNEFAKAINNEELVVFAYGKLYEEVQEKIKKDKKKVKSNKRGKVLSVGGVALGIACVPSAPILGPILAVSSALSFLANIGGVELKKYDIKDNSEKKRIELYRNCYSMKGDGSDAFSEEYDSVIE